MTDAEYAAMAQKLGLAGEGLVSPSQIDAMGAKSLKDVTDNPPATPSLLSPQFAISNAPADVAAGRARDTVNQFATDTSGSQGLSTDALRAVLAPDQTSLDSPGVSKAIDQSIQYHQQKAAGQQASLNQAISTLGNLDATDADKEAAHTTIQSIPTVYDRSQDKDVVLNPAGAKLPGSSLTRNQEAFLSLDKIKGMGYSDEDAHKLQQQAFVANITPAEDPAFANLQRQTNLNTGPSYRALQDLGLQFPGTTGKYQTGSPIATAPIFQPNAPPPPQKIEKALPVPGQTVDASGKVVQAPASSIGLTTVRGTEFGQIDNPARGGYTEAGWNVGAWGGDIADMKTPFVALPVKTLSQYGNPGDKNYADTFNSKYDIQVTDPATGKVIVTSLRDKGPGAKTGAGIDMSWATREGLGLKPNYSGNIAYRIVPKGSALPDNTTPSVAQTTQTQTTKDGQFTTDPNNPMQVFIKPLDPSDIKDPWVHGSGMSTGDVAKWARYQTDQYAQQMEEAGTPLKMSEYKAQYQKFFEGGAKYQDQDLKLEPVDAEHNDQFASLANLVSPTGASFGGKPMSQLDLMEKAFLDAKKTAPGGAMAQWPSQLGGYNEQVRLYQAQQEHLVPNIARGMLGQKGNLSEGEQEGARKTLPEAGDSEALGQQKMQILRAGIQDQMRRIIQIGKAEHHDTSALEQQYRQIFVNAPSATAAANRAGIQSTTNKVLAQSGGGASQSQSPAQRAATQESQAVKNPPPNF